MKHINDTLKHIIRVSHYINIIIKELLDRAEKHDASKLIEPECSVFESYADKLNGLTYGSKEYYENLNNLKVALDNHYKLNSHHPQYHTNGINDMTLVDIIEMYCDWCAAVERHKDGNMLNSIEKNKERFNMSEQLAMIFQNTYLKNKEE